MRQEKILTGIVILLTVLVIYGIVQRKTINNAIGARILTPSLQEPFQESNSDTVVKVCYNFFSPFNEPTRDTFNTLSKRVVGRYGDYRRSSKVGHRHAGVDFKGAFSELIYAIGNGQVIEIFDSYPNGSIVIRHHLPDSSFLYSVYTHVEDVKVMIGDWVHENTPLARLFTEEELERADFGTPNHLHLEIRKSYKDYGTASWRSMTMEDLNKYCLDPLKFFKSKLGK